MTDPVRWGILGAANFAAEYMGPAIQRARGAVLAGLATSSPEKAAPFLDLAPELRVFDSYDALLADPDIDAVYVPLPNHLHVEWTLRALEAGKPVLTEKPIAMAESDFDAMIAARDRAGVLAAEGFMILHHPQWLRAREILRSGRLGRLAHVDAMFCYNNADAPGNIRNRPETGGGALRDIGVYIFGATRFATGEEPESMDVRITWENGVDVLSHMVARFPGFSFNGVVSMRLQPAQCMTFYGDRGLMRLTGPFNARVFRQAELQLETGGLEVLTERWPEADHYVNQVEAFVASLRTGAAYPCPLEFSRGTQRMIDMAFAAAGG